jgi:hypothetical protein
MTFQEALDAAVAWGYRGPPGVGGDSDVRHAPSAGAGGSRHQPEDPMGMRVPATLLDPQFWRVLGLVLGWHAGWAPKYLPYDQWWRPWWHRFLDHLAAGKSPAAFFAPFQAPLSTALAPCPPALPLPRRRELP